MGADAHDKPSMLQALQETITFVCELEKQVSLAPVFLSEG
jgi:hypothetical protein